MEAVKSIETALDVSPLVTSIVEHEFTLPHCSYQLKQRGVDGPLMKYATIGEPITHLWQCDPIAGWLYGLLIHSCFVDDGHGKNRFDLIDERGCVTDRSLLAEISYDEKAFTAYAHTHVFRYADRIQLFFTCTIQLCFREDGGCDGISPPQCNKGKVGSPFPETPVSPSFVPIDSHEESPIFRRGHLHSKSSLSLKDSPILTINNESVIEEQLLGDTFQPSLNNHSRAGRNAALEFLNNRMETDLSADLTVVPRTSNGMAERSKDERMAGRDPFIRVFPIKNGEYGTATPQIYSLDSQRFGSFEVLAIAVASFLITITFVLLITTFGLQHCRLKKLLVHKLCSTENDGAIIIG